MLSVAVIGTGSMGRNHVRVLNDIANLVGIADLSQECLGPLGKTYDAPCFTDFDEILRKEDLDAVSIATPTVTHYEIAKKALLAGKHVHLEKPMCETVTQGIELRDIAKDQGLKLAIGFIERHNPISRFTKNLIAGNQLGDIIDLTTRRVSSYPARIRDVGVIMDLGVHDMDILRYFAGSNVTSVYTLAGSQENPKFEDHANVLMEFQNGIIGHLEVNWLTPMKSRKVFFTTSKNFCEMDYTAQSLEITTSKFMDIDHGNLFRIPQTYDTEKIVVAQQEPLKLELEDFLGAIEENRDPLVTAEDGIHVLNIALACIESMKQKKNIPVEELNV
jgi:UDP-N-acetylglucosamine 3-dehydrogenase